MHMLGCRVLILPSEKTLWIERLSNSRILCLENAPALFAQSLIGSRYCQTLDMSCPNMVNSELVKMPLKIPKSDEWVGGMPKNKPSIALLHQSSSCATPTLQLSLTHTASNNSKEQLAWQYYSSLSVILTYMQPNWDIPSYSAVAHPPWALISAMQGCTQVALHRLYIIIAFPKLLQGSWEPGKCLHGERGGVAIVPRDHEPPLPRDLFLTMGVVLASCRVLEVHCPSNTSAVIARISCQQLLQKLEVADEFGNKGYLLQPRGR